jgi:Xaa-Pro aminopeptidase
VVATDVIGPPPAASALGALARWLKSARFRAGSRVAVVGSAGVSAMITRALLAELPGVAIEEVPALLGAVMAAREPRDHAGLAAAAVVADKGLAAAARIATPGTRLTQLKAEVESEVVSSGSELTLVVVGSGPVGGITEARVLRAGDLVSVLVEVCVQGYWVEAGAIFAAKIAKRRDRDLAAECEELLASLVPMLSPGVPASRLWTHAGDFVTARRRRLTLGLGHGVGFDSVPPVLSPGNEEPFAAAAAIALHPSIADVAMQGGVALANTYVLGSAGASALSVLGGRLHVSEL